MFGQKNPAIWPSPPSINKQHSRSKVKRQEGLCAVKKMEFFHQPSKTTVAIGIGCNKGCSSEVIVALTERAIAAASCAGAPAALFTHDAKEGEAGLASAAKALGLPLVFLDGQVLRQASLRAATNSPRVMRMFGLPSIAEATALAGRGAVLRPARARMSDGGASCAMAGKREP